MCACFVSIASPNHLSKKQSWSFLDQTIHHIVVLSCPKSGSIYRKPLIIMRQRSKKKTRRTRYRGGGRFYCFSVKPSNSSSLETAPSLNGGLGGISTAPCRCPSFSACRKFALVVEADGPGCRAACLSSARVWPRIICRRWLGGVCFSDSSSKPPWSTPTRIIASRLCAAFEWL